MNNVTTVSAPAGQQIFEEIAGDTTARIRPSCKREAVLFKVNSWKNNNMTAKERKVYETYIDRTSRLFIQLCWSKLGVSDNQLKELDNAELEEMAKIIHEKTVIPNLINQLFLACIPIIGWLIIYFAIDPNETLKKNHNYLYTNMRYFWWHRKIRKLSGKNFVPDMNTSQN